MNDETSLPPVQYSVRIETSEWGDHPATVFEEEHWEVRGFELDETLHRPYWLDLTVLTTDTEIDIDTLVGGRFTMTWRRGDDERFVHGIVRRAWYLGTFRDAMHIRLKVGPALALLDVGRRSRVFQALSVVQIAEELVSETLGPLERTIDTSRLLRTYDELDYCVQFRESDLDFLTRILAREGIGYLFEHDEQSETIVLFDDPRAFQGATEIPDATERPPPVVTVLTSVGGRPGVEAISRFEWRRHTRPRRLASASEDWKAFDRAPLHSTVASLDNGEKQAPWEYGERYEHRFRRLVEDGGNGPHLDHHPRTAQDLHEYGEADSQAAIGSSTAFAFSVGQTFEIEGHPHVVLDRGYSLTRVVHRADCPEVDIDAASAFAGPNYENHFECIPLEVPWRPRPPTRPSVQGHLLATVVGPKGEEIHTDEHGRIKVWIHWDREHGPEDPDSSCWIRVAQTWAGPGWGTMFIPRVGMEVLISFADGDPDAPLCVGCVYNGHNTPPYTLPEDRTKSTIKTRSSPGGDGFNELRFEDAAGNEEVFVHAQRDFNEVVENAHARSVGFRESITVGDDRTLAVSGSQTVTVEGNHHVTVNGKSKDGMAEPPPHYAIDVDSDFALKATKTIALEATELITLTVGGTSIQLTPQGITLAAAQGSNVALHAATTVSSNAGATVHLDEAGGLAVAAKVGKAAGATLNLDAAATMASKAGASVTLNDSAVLGASAASPATPGASLTLDDSATIAGQRISHNAERASLVLDVGANLEAPKIEIRGSDLTIEGARTTINAAQLTAQGAAMVTITAPLVKIN